MGHWFKHDSDARSDIKLKSLVAMLGLEAKAIWWDFLEILSDQKNLKISKLLVSGVALDIGITIEKLNEFLKVCYQLDLLSQDDQFIFSESLIVRLNEYEEKKSKDRDRKKNGKILENQGKVLESAWNASISNSISTSRSLDLDKKEVVATPPQGKTERAKGVWLDDSEIELAKSHYRKTGLESEDVELYGFVEVSAHYEYFPEKISKNMAYSDLVSIRTIQKIIKLKTEQQKLQKTKDPPKSYKDVEAEKEKKRRDELREKYRLEDEQRELEEKQEELKNENRKNEKTGIDGLLGRTLNQLPKLQAH